MGVLFRLIQSEWREAKCRRLGALADQAWRNGDAGGAIATYQRLLSISPGDARALGNLASVHIGAGRTDEASRLLEMAVHLHPELAGLHVNLGNLRVLEGNFPHAVACYQEALRLDPNSYAAYGNCFRAYMEMCDWAGFGRHFDGLLHYRDVGDEHWVRRIAAYTSLLVPLTSKDQLAIARDAAKDYTTARIDAQLHREPPARITVAYLSGDYYDHATMHLAAGMFERHDKSKFRVLAYSLANGGGDEVTKRVQHACDEFHDVSMLSAGAAAKAIRSANVDILVDMKGYTGGGRPEILALRPAPVQVSFLGYPGTMGADFIDYMIADRIVIPTDMADDYSESIVWMPDTYQVTDNAQLKVSCDIPRDQCALPEDAFVYCSFNQSYKIDRRTFDAWMRILSGTTNTVLWLLANNPLAVANLSAACEKSGVDPKRLIFAKPVPRAQHLERIQLADLMLDTFVVNAHTTTTDALWVGLPVLTLVGSTFASRVAASVLTAYGLEHLRCRSEDEYVATAITLAQDRSRLSDVRRGHEERRIKSPLFDTNRYVSHLELAYQRMMATRARCGPPESFVVG